VRQLRDCLFRCLNRAPPSADIDILRTQLAEMQEEKTLLKDPVQLPIKSSTEPITPESSVTEEPKKKKLRKRKIVVSTQYFSDIKKL
jgi:hypothetical protein